MFLQIIRGDMMSSHSLFCDESDSELLFVPINQEVIGEREGDEDL